MKSRKIVTELVSFTLLLILSGLFQQLFSRVDSFIVGNINGEAAFAAIGATNSIYSLFVSLITGFHNLTSKEADVFQGGRGIAFLQCL